MIDVIDLLALDFVRNSLIAALLVGITAPLVGIFPVSYTHLTLPTKRIV